MDIPVIFQSEDLLVVNKPPGIATIPERGLSQTSVQRLLESQYGRKLWVVHRLDKEVSGVLVWAWNPQTHRLWNLAFENREVHKRYLGWVWGCPSPGSGEIRARIHQFGSGRMGVDPRGKESLTRYQVLETRGKFSLVELEPYTGRRHQLRVHLFHLGHPLVGDPLYGDKQAQDRFPRLFLHSQRLEGRVGGIPWAWEAPTAPDFAPEYGP